MGDRPSARAERRARHGLKAKRIFCFWEPQGAITPYLELCLRTWERNAPGYEIVRLDHSNLDRYVPAGTYDMPTLTRLDLALQKDAIMVAVLQEHGGIFMDVDTLVTKDLAPIVQGLARTEAIMFDSHVAFIAARPGARLLTCWLKSVQKRLARLNQADPPLPGWDYIGNRGLEDAMVDLIGASLLGRAYDGIVRTQATWPRWARSAWQSVPGRIWARRIDVLLRTTHRESLMRLDRRRHAFIAESRFFKDQKADRRQQYLEFWFVERSNAKIAFPSNQRLIALHNSWTPEWYKQLTIEEVLAHPCLLSRTIRDILTTSARR
jgi:hypothetical protein